MGADGANFKIKSGAVERGGAGFDGVDGLIEAVEGGVELPLRILGEMEDQVELSFAGLEGAGIDALQGGSRRLSPGYKGGEEEEQGGDGVTISMAQKWLLGLAQGFSTG